MLKRVLACMLAVVMAVLCLVLPASAASATLTEDVASVWTSKILAKQVKLISASNIKTAANRTVYFDFKYYNGSTWKTDKNAVSLAPDTAIVFPIYSNNLGEQMNWRLQINTWCCLYKGASAYGSITAA